MKCPRHPQCSGTISYIENEDGIHYFPCNECRGYFKEEKMPEIRNNISCPTPGCHGSRADIVETDDNGNWVSQRSEPCQVCGAG